MVKLMARVLIAILWQATISLLSTAISFTKMVRQGMIIKWRQDVFGIKSSTIPLPRILACKHDTKDDRTKNTNIKYGGKYGNGQVPEPDVKTVDIPGNDAPQGFVSYSEEEKCIPKWFDMSSLPKVMSIYYILFRQHPNSISSPRRCGLKNLNFGLFQNTRDIALWY